MRPKLALWILLVAMTALAPGIAVGRLARSRQWSEKRRDRTSKWSAVAIMMVCGCAATFGLHKQPWAWATEPWPLTYPVALGAWLLAVWTARRIARKIACPGSQRQV